jgi:hypothetical protein
VLEVFHGAIHGSGCNESRWMCTVKTAKKTRHTLRMLSRAPSRIAWATLVGENKVFVDGDLSKDGIIDVDLTALTL